MILLTEPGFSFFFFPEKTRDDAFNRLLEIEIDVLSFLSLSENYYYSRVKSLINFNPKILIQ